MKKCCAVVLLNMVVHSSSSLTTHHIFRRQCLENSASTVVAGSMLGMIMSIFSFFVKYSRLLKKSGESNEGAVSILAKFEIAYFLFSFSREKQSSDMASCFAAEKKCSIRDTRFAAPRKSILLCIARVPSGVFLVR